MKKIEIIKLFVTACANICEMAYRYDMPLCLICNYI